MATIVKPTYPNVPQQSGVPQLRRSSAFPASAGPVLGTALAIGRLWRALTAKSQWGIFKTVTELTGITATLGGVTVEQTRDKQVQVVSADSVLDFGYRNEVDVSDYPVQEGGFTNYNRVANPFEASVRLSKGGSVAERAKFLSDCDSILASTTLYQIYTPERTYFNVNPVRVEVTRKGAGGAYFLTEVDVYFREIRTTTAQYTNSASATQDAKNPSASPVTNNGVVSSQSIDSSVPLPTNVVSQ